VIRMCNRGGGKKKKRKMIRKWEFDVTLRGPGEATIITGAESKKKSEKA